MRLAQRNSRVDGEHPCIITRSGATINYGAATLVSVISMGYTLFPLRATMLIRMLLFFLLFLAALPVFMVVTGQAQFGRDFRRADRSSAGIAPPAENTPEAVVQVYAARALNWRGIFGCIRGSLRNRKTQRYHAHQVIGWRLYRNLPPSFPLPAPRMVAGLATNHR